MRSAAPSDAPAIVGLYQDSYASTDGRAPAENYPYPQMLDAEWVAASLRAGRIEALVAEDKGHLCGAAAVARELKEGSGLAEFFGLTMAPGSRRNGLATRLLQQLCERVGRSVQVAIGEVRTVDPGAALVVQETALQPVGFEPFAHFMLAGAESMIAVCAASAEALHSRSRAGGTTPRAGRLARLVLAPFGVPPPAVRHPARAAVISGESARCDLVSLAPSALRAERPRPGCIGRGALLTVHQMEVLARSPSAFEQRAYALFLRSHLIATARVARDHRDHRVRILEVGADRPGFAQAMLQQLGEVLEREAKGQLLVIVAEVSTEHPAMQAALEAAAFRPTAYFPAAVYHAGRRFDAIQYSRVSGGSPALSATNALAAWPRARAVVEHVVGSLDCVSAPGA